MMDVVVVAAGSDQCLGFVIQTERASMKQ